MRRDKMKTCKVCGYSVPDGTTECPNCGSFEFMVTDEDNGKFKSFRKYI